MGCISSKVVLARSPSHHDHHQFNRHLLAFLSPSQPTISALHLDHNLTDFEDAKHTIDALELIPDSKHDEIMEIGDVDSNTNSNSNDQYHYRRYSKSCQSSPNENKATIERCASFHTVEEYDALIRRISASDKEEINSTDDNDRRGRRRKKIGEALAGSLNVEFQTVGSLRQWLEDNFHSPDGRGGGGVGAGDAAADYPTPKFGSYCCSNNQQAPGIDSVFIEIGGKQQEEESVPEIDPDLVAAFEEYMQQLQVEEDSILRVMDADRAP